ncbi:MAG: hypothetical protein J2P57_24815, partial [Acidimicrobiaceae bacterium]|nr:hypothetical protein [Acidimicrobiaceae bacterium]
PARVPGQDLPSRRSRLCSQSEDGLTALERKLSEHDRRFDRIDDRFGRMDDRFGAVVAAVKL